VSFFAAAVDLLFEQLGEEATYHFKAGGAQGVRVMPKRNDVVASFGDTRAVKQTGLFDLRKSEIANPVAGDRLELADGSWRELQGKPMTEDSDRLIWTLDTKVAAP